MPDVKFVHPLHGFTVTVKEDGTVIDENGNVIKEAKNIKDAIKWMNGQGKDTKTT